MAPAPRRGHQRRCGATRGQLTSSSQGIHSCSRAVGRQDVGVAWRALWVPVMACGLAAGCTAAGAPAPAVSAGAPFVYVTGKGGTNEISQFATLGSGALRPLTPGKVATAGVPSGLIAVSPDGKNAYVPSGKAISQYRISSATGKLTPMPPRKVAGAGSPVGIKVAPDGRYLYFVSGIQCLAPKGSTGNKCTHSA